MNRIEKQKEEARNINGLVNYLIDLIESMKTLQKKTSSIGHNV